MYRNLIHESDKNRFRNVFIGLVLNKAIIN